MSRRRGDPSRPRRGRLENLHIDAPAAERPTSRRAAPFALLWSEERQDWLLPAAEVPMSVLRYTQRMGEPLVVGDTTRDDRFARDPYFRDVDGASLLAVPVSSRGSLRAVLVLENRLIRGAFSPDRLDVVRLIVGQLAVSLDNAELYAELAASRGRIVAAADEARRRIERDLHDGAQQRFVHTIVAVKLAQVAVGSGRGRPRRSSPTRSRARSAGWTRSVSWHTASTPGSCPRAGWAPR
jgi:GAF domain-containing protein